MVENNVELKAKENKLLKTLGNIGFAVFMIIMLVMILITGQSRLTGQEPSILGHRLYIVDSGSMVPTLPLDSMIIVREISPDQIVEGDIVTFYARASDIRVTHRVVEIVEEGKEFITKGDANNIRDFSILEGDRVIGKLAFAIPFIGKIFRFLSSRAGIAALIILGAIFIILPKVIRLFK